MPLFSRTAKVWLNNGSSLSLVIPKEFAEELGIKAGNQVKIEYDPNGKCIKILPTISE